MAQKVAITREEMKRLRQKYLERICKYSEKWRQLEKLLKEVREIANESKLL